jgi:hypothetical protein
MEMLPLPKFSKEELLQKALPTSDDEDGDDE